MLTLLEIRNVIAAPQQALGLKAHVHQQRLQLPARLLVRGGQLQMIALLGIGTAAPRQKDAPQKGGADRKKPKSPFQICGW